MQSAPVTCWHAKDSCTPIGASTYWHTKVNDGWLVVPAVLLLLL